MGLVIGRAAKKNSILNQTGMLGLQITPSTDFPIFAPSKVLVLPGAVVRANLG